MSEAPVTRLDTARGRGLRVRRLAPPDRPVWLALRSAMAPGVALAAHERRVASVLSKRGDAGAFLCVSADDAPAGLVEVSRRNAGDPGDPRPVAAIDALHVDAGGDGASVTRALLDAAARWAADQGCGALEAEADAADEGLFRHLRRAEFEPCRPRRRLRRTVAPAASVSPIPAGVAAAPSAPPPEMLVPVAPGSPGTGARWVHGVLMVLGAASFYFSDPWSGDVLRGAVLPMLDVLFVLYLMALFVVVKYRARTAGHEPAPPLPPLSRTPSCAPR